MPNGDSINIALPPITHEAEAKRVRKHRIFNQTQLLAYKLFFAHLGKFIVVALYFLLLEVLKGQHTTLFSWHVTMPEVKQTWDSLFSASIANGGFIHLMSPAHWDGMRHVVFRGLVEGVLGMMLFKQIGFKVDKYKAKLDKKGEPGRFDRLVLRTKVFASPYQDHPVTALQYCFLPVLVVLVTIVLGVPLYLGVNSLAHTWSLHWLATPGVQHNIAQKLYTGSEVYEGLIIGLVVGIVAARTYTRYLYANTVNYGSLWVANGRKEHWWMPWPTRQYLRELRASAKLGKAPEVHVHPAFLSAMLALSVALAVFGYFVLQTNGFTS